MSLFIENLIKLRKSRKLSQDDIAERLGISRPAYGRYEQGSAEPTINNLIVLAEMFDVSVDFLVGKPYEEIRVTNDTSGKLMEDAISEFIRENKHELIEILVNRISKENLK